MRAAASRFASQDFATASLNEILREAGWAKSSFYYRHENKTALHDDLVRTLAERLAEGVNAPELNRLDARELWAAMEALAQQFARAAAHHPETQQLGLMHHRDETVLPSSELARLQATTENWVRTLVARAAELGLLREDVSVDLAVHLTLGVLVRSIVGLLNAPALPVRCYPVLSTLFGECSGSPSCDWGHHRRKCGGNRNDSPTEGRPQDYRQRLHQRDD